METVTSEKQGGGIKSKLDLKRERSLRFSIWEACFYASMVGFGETYFVPLLVAIGGSNFQVGIFTSIPQLCISFSQFISIFLVERLMVRKRIAVGAISIQLLMLAAIFGGVALGKLSPWLFIIFSAGYHAANGTALPAWNSLMGDYTTPRNRGQYFGRRSGLSQLITFCAVLAAGIILQNFANRGVALTGFSIILLAAVFSRAGSIYTLIRHFEFPYKKVEGSYFSIWQFIRRSPKSNFAHFVYFQSLMNFAVQISAPFFIVFMLKDLGYSYFQYTIAQGTFIATHFIAMRRWGPFADKYGNRIVLKITAYVMPVLPIVWLFSHNFYYIICIQVLSGLTWGGWTLCSSNFIYDAVTPPKRARCAAYSNFFNGIGIFAGALLGAFMSSQIPSVLNFGFTKVSLVSQLEMLFFISGLARLALVVAMLPSFREVRDVSEPRVKDMFMMLTHVRPLTGSSHEFYTAVDKGDDQHEGHIWKTHDGNP